MTLGMFNQELHDTEGFDNFRIDGILRRTASIKKTALANFGLVLSLICFPMVVFAGDGPQELPKPTHMTVAPIFQEWQFDTSTLNEVPEGFSLEVGGTSQKGGWVVKEDNLAPSQPKTAEQHLTCEKGLCYQLLSVDGVTVEYVDLSVRMKMRLGTPSGKAGLAYGIQDAQNFYAVVVEPKTNEIVAYVVKAGEAKEIARETLIVEPSEWHFLRIQRNTIVSKEFTEIFFDHHLMIDVYDQSFKIGKIGLVAMEDGAFSFDNLRAIELMSNRPLSRPAAY